MTFWISWSNTGSFSGDRVTNTFPSSMRREGDRTPREKETRDEQKGREVHFEYMLASEPIATFLHPASNTELDALVGRGGSGDELDSLFA